jgi:DNA invertase Pin-like site-specific DNA recombinase
MSLIGPLQTFAAGKIKCDAHRTADVRASRQLNMSLKLVSQFTNYVTGVATDSVLKLGRSRASWRNPAMIFGYARVSTTGQTLEAQIEQLTVAGCARIYRETASGARSDREQLKKLLRNIKQGDQLVVTRLDRLARSILDLLNTLERVADHNATFRSLAEPWADTKAPAGRFMLTMICWLAEFERHLIRERTGEGRERARRAGVKFGPKEKLSPQQKEEAWRRTVAGESLRAIGRAYGVSHSTIHRVQPSNGTV